MKLKDALKNFKVLNFAQKFLAFILLIQVSSILVGIIMRIFAEFGLFHVAISLYLLFIVLGLVLMFVLLASIQGRAGSYFTAALSYFLIASLLMVLISSIEGGIFSVFEVKSSILVTWGFTNLLFSIVILIVALLRLMVLGAVKDYQRPPKPATGSSVAV